MHFAVHSGPETLRHRFDVPVSSHDFADTYAPAFRATVAEGHADSVMGADSAGHGAPSCATHFLLDTWRSKWGFEGYVVSDCWAISDIHQGHGYVLTLEQADALAVKAGTDLSCGPEYAALPFAVENRLLSPGDVDRAVKHLFEARFRLGMFDPPESVPWSKLTLADNDTPAHRQLALEAARQSIVLLKNEGNLLPLRSSVKSIAVVRSEEHTSELQSLRHLVCRLLLEKKKNLCTRDTLLNAYNNNTTYDRFTREYMPKALTPVMRFGCRAADFRLARRTAKTIGHLDCG